MQFLMFLEIFGPFARCLLPLQPRGADDQMKRSRRPPVKVSDWIEFCWLYVVSPVFRSAPNKRKAYFEHRLGKIYNLPCF